MKNVKMLILLMMVVLGTVSGLDAESIDYTPYVTGNGLDKNGRNIYHIFALNCDAYSFQEQLSELERVGHQSSDVKKITPSVMAIDKNGDTPLFLSRKNQKQFGSYRCARMTRWLLELEQTERSKK